MYFGFLLLLLLFMGVFVLGFCFFWFTVDILSSNLHFCSKPQEQCYFNDVPPEKELL